ncbi:MAG TPA: Crp/Fnr family transcriptional regulator [Lachnospiraceae bacterium]|nr:Crp/Fnr family transcriptional regulator [Lachnospiraceae bacterium]
MEGKKMSCGHCQNKLCMHKVPIFSNLEKEDILSISSLIKHHEYRKGEHIFNIGDNVDSIIIMNEGSVKAYKDTLDGREQILYIFSVGDFFGEQYLLSNQTAAYTVETLETVKVCMLSKAQFRELLFEHPEIAVKIIEELGERMNRLENSMQSMGVRSVDTRIGSLLMDFSQKYGQEVPEGTLIRLPLSREGIANYLGIARETVSRKLSQLENDGIIRTVSNRSILIIDRDALSNPSI